MKIWSQSRNEVFTPDFVKRYNVFCTQRTLPFYLTSEITVLVYAGPFGDYVDRKTRCGLLANMIDYIFRQYHLINGRTWKVETIDVYDYLGLQVYHLVPELLVVVVRSTLGSIVSCT